MEQFQIYWNSQLICDKISSKIKVKMNLLNYFYARYKTKNTRLFRYCSQVAPKRFIQLSYEKHPQITDHMKQLSIKYIKAMTILFEYEDGDEIYKTLRALRATLSKLDVEEIFEHIFLISIMRDVFYNDTQPFYDNQAIPESLHKQLKINMIQSKEVKSLVLSSIDEIKNNKFFQMLFSNETQTQSFYNDFHEATESGIQPKNYQYHLHNNEEKKKQDSKLKNLIKIVPQTQKKLKTVRGRIHNKEYQFQVPFLKQFQRQIEKEVCERDESDHPREIDIQLEQDMQEDSNENKYIIRDQLLKYLNKFKALARKQEYNQDELNQVVYQFQDFI